MIKTGYVQESLNMTVIPIDPDSPTAITATIDRDTFVAEVSQSGTYTFTYSTVWSSDPAEYGITVNGTPAAGDQISVVYVKENRGTITTASPTAFVSTGWNLYNHSAGYARLVKYSEEYGFMIDGTYTALSFSGTLSGNRVSITPVDGYFTIPSDGYLFVTGGNNTDTAIWMTWSDWVDEPNGGTFEEYTQTQIDLTGIMVNFPYGLMRIDNIYDEIDLNTLRAYSRIERLSYTEENLSAVIASGVPYDTDTGYIYAVRVAPVTYIVNIDGEYTVSDHGEEMFLGTSVALTVSCLYGNDLKNKLRRDVLTISEQSLTAAQKTQVQNNLGLVPTTATDKNVAGFVADARVIKRLFDILSIKYATATKPEGSNTWTAGTISLRKSGRLVQLKIDGATLAAITGRVTFAEVPAGFRPVTEVYFVNSANNKKYVLSYEGQLKGETAEAGQVWATVTYMAQTAE